VTFRRFLALLASRHGQILNKTDLAAPLGVSVPTISDWLHILEVTGQIMLRERLEAAIRGRVREVIELILEEEVDAALGAGRSQRVAERCGYRHGHKPRRLTLRTGAVELEAPRGRLVTPDGGEREWHRSGGREDPVSVPGCDLSQGAQRGESGVTGGTGDVGSQRHGREGAAESAECWSGEHRRLADVAGGRWVVRDW
jgi:Transposase, Mutator family